MRLKRFNTVYTDVSITITSVEQDGKYIVNLVLKKTEKKDTVYVSSNRDSAKFEIDRWLKLYTSLTATERARVNNIPRKKK